MIRVNDKFDVEWQEGMTVNSLLSILKFTFPMIIVSVNGKVIPKSEYGMTTIQDNDEVKVIHLVAGGCLRLGRLGLQLTRPAKTLRIEVNDGRRRWQPRSPAMAAGVTDYIWTVQELWMTVVVPDVITN